MSRPALLLALFILFGDAHGQERDTVAVTLEQCISSALAGNPEIRMAGMQVEHAELEQQSVRGQFFPQVSIDGQYTRNIKRPVFFLPPGESFGGGPPSSEGTIIEAGFDNSYNIGAQATMPLYNRELIVATTAAEATVQVEEKQVLIRQNEIRTQVKKAYFESLLARESLEVLQQSLLNAERNFENVRSQFRQQLVPEYDVIRAEVQVENLRPDLIQAENNYEAAINNLKLLSDLPDDVPLKLSQTLQDLYQISEPRSLESRFGIAGNPTLQQLDQQYQLLETQLTLQRAAFYPSLSAFANYSWQAQANNFDFGNYFWVNTAAVGIQLSIPVFEGLARVRRVQQAKIDMRQLQLQRDYQEKSLSLQARNALKVIARARQSYLAQERNIEQAQRGYQIAQVSYNSGVGTLIEVNDAELALTQARLNQLQAIYEYLNALADFSQLTGTENMDK